MIRFLTSALALLVAMPMALAAVAAPAFAQDATLVSLPTPRGAKQAFILIKPDKPPVASVILFAGGHGALKLAMTHPGIFGVVYAMNPLMLGWGGDVSVDNPALAETGRVQSQEDLSKAGFYVQAVVGIGQCFSPRLDAPLLTSPPFVADADLVIAYDADEEAT